MQSKLPGSEAEVNLTYYVLHLRKKPHLRRFTDLTMTETTDFHRKTCGINMLPNPTSFTRTASSHRTKFNGSKSSNHKIQRLEVFEPANNPRFRQLARNFSIRAEIHRTKPNFPTLATKASSGTAHIN